MKVDNTSGIWYKYKSESCPRCGISGPHYCGQPNTCMFEGLDSNKVYGLACNCEKCSPQSTVNNLGNNVDISV